MISISLMDMVMLLLVTISLASTTETNVDEDVIERLQVFLLMRRGIKRIPRLRGIICLLVHGLGTEVLHPHHHPRVVSFCSGE